VTVLTARVAGWVPEQVDAGDRIRRGRPRPAISCRLLRPVRLRAAGLPAVDRGDCGAEHCGEPRPGNLGNREQRRGLVDPAGQQGIARHDREQERGVGGGCPQATAAEGQRQLCRGQGAELVWSRQPEPLSSQQVLDIFRCKTAPAFEVALRLGALYAGTHSHDEVSEVLQAYSEALGIAYQIRDDLSDLGAEGETNDIAGLRPSLLLAVAHEKAKDQQKELLGSVWRRSLPEGATFQQIEALYGDLQVTDRVRTLLETYKEEGIRCLRDLENLNLKGLLRRIIGKIFNDVEIKGWCKEQEQTNAALRENSEVQSV